MILPQSHKNSKNHKETLCATLCFSALVAIKRAKFSSISILNQFQ